MASPDDNARHEGTPPDGRPRRQPPIIDVKAVEVSLDGSNAAGTDANSAGTFRSRILTFLHSTRFAVIASLCLAAGIIAGALWVYAELYPAADSGGSPEQNSPGHAAVVPDDLVERIAKLEDALKTVPVQASPEQALPNAEPIADLANRVAALEAKLAPLGERIAALERSARDTAAAARLAGERADRVARLLDDAKKGGDEQNSLQRERGSLEAHEDRLKTLESAQTALRQKQEELDRVESTAAPDAAGRAAIVAAALRTAVERESPFTVELAAARSLGLDERALAALEPFAATGVPMRNELFRTMSALLPELQRVLAPNGRDLNYLERLQASAAKMMNIRPVGNEPGDNPAAVISRIEFRMARQDIAAVTAELDKLPAPAKELVEPWRTKALARQEAVESARLIATASLAKLGEPAVRGPLPQ